MLRRVRHCEPAARTELSHFESVLLPHLRSELKHGVDGLRVRLQLEHRRAQVHMQTNQLQPRHLQCLPERGFSLARRQRDPELVLERAGRRLHVRMRVDPRREPQQDLLPHPPALRDAVQQVQLVKIVHHDAANTVVERLAQLLLRLVVAVEVHPLGREVHRRSHRELASRHDVEAHPFLHDDPPQRTPQVRLRRVRHD